MDAARRSKRYPSEQPLQVRCDTWREFVQLYAGDIGQGGMFILTDDPPPLMSSVDIRLTLPEATEILLAGRVVHVITKELAQAEGKEAGAGIEFTDMDAERKRQIIQLVEFARWQGATGAPGASYARAMFEASASTPGAKATLPVDTTGAAGARSPPARTAPNPDAARTGAAQGSRRVTSNPDTGAPAAKDPKRSTLSERQKPPAESDPRKITLDGVQSSVHPEDQAFSLRPPTDSRKPEPKRSDSTVRTREATAGAQTAPSSSAPPTTPEPAAPGNLKPTDPVELKVAMTHFAHKRYDQALKALAKMLENNPGDPQVMKWQHMCRAREALAKNDAKAAVEHYEKALPFDEGNREARDFVRNYHRDKRLSALPFGRYFVKKK